MDERVFHLLVPRLACDFATLHLPDALGRLWTATRKERVVSDLRIDGELVLPGVLTANGYLPPDVIDHLAAAVLQSVQDLQTSRLFGEAPVPTRPTCLADVMLHDYLDSQGRLWRVDVEHHAVHLCRQGDSRPALVCWSVRCLPFLVQTASQTLRLAYQPAQR